MAMKIDELNSPKEFDSEEYIKNYFKPMRISEDRKEEREDAARDFRDVLLFILALIAVENEYNALNWAYIEEQFRGELEKAALRYARSTQALQDYIAEKASDFIGITREHDLTDSYWTSDERATYEAVNEANSVVSMGELQRAKELGAEKKRWRTERDNRVRFTHMRVDGKSVALDRMFEVGDALMRFPGDFVHSVRESVNCRCCLEYIDGDGNVVMVGKHGATGTTATTDLIQNENSSKGIEHKPTMVQWSKVNNPGYGQKISRIEPDRYMASRIKTEGRKILEHRSGSNYYEDMTYIDSSTGESLSQTQYEAPREVFPTEDMIKMLQRLPRKSIIALHNHHENAVPSVKDVVAAQDYKYGVILCHNGDLYKYTVKDLNASFYSAALSKVNQTSYTKQDMDVFIQEASEAGVEIEAYRW